MDQNEKVLCLQVYTQVRDVLFTDDAVVGEAASTAMGLTMVASLNQNAFDVSFLYISLISALFWFNVIFIVI